MSPLLLMLCVSPVSVDHDALAALALAKAARCRPVVKIPVAPKVIQRIAGSTWDWQGVPSSATTTATMRTHLMASHGLTAAQVNAMSRADLIAAHDDDHNGRKAAPKAASFRDANGCLWQLQANGTYLKTSCPFQR